MRKVQGLSYPRSGSSLLQRILIGYFGNSIKKTAPQTLIKRSKSHFARHHDFDHMCTKIATRQYLVQYRNPIRSIVSLAIKEKHPIKKQFKNPHGIKHWKWFVKKWVLNPTDNIYLLDYQDFILDFENQMFNVVGLFEEQPDIDKIILLKQEFDVRPRKRLENLSEKHSKAFDEYEKQMSDYMEEAKILPWREAI